MKKVISIALSLAIVLTFVPSMFATDSKKAVEESMSTTPPQTYNLYVPIEKQDQPNSCWAAAGSSICRELGVNVSETKFASDSGFPMDNGNVPGQDEDVVIVGFNRNGIACDYSTDYLSFSEYIYTIYSGSPVFADVAQHAIVLEGYDNVGGLRYVYFMDPSTSKKTNQVWTYNELIDNSITLAYPYYWTESLYNFSK